MFDETAKPEATAVFDTDGTDFSNPNVIKTTEYSQQKLITLEPFRCAMDGEWRGFPADRATITPWAFWGTQLSDENGEFAIPHKLTISFSKEHLIPGVTLHFDEGANEWASEVLVRFLDDRGGALSSLTVYPDRPKFFIRNRVDRCVRIECTFYGTSQPYRYLKLANVDMGLQLVFEGAEIVSAKVDFEVDPYCGQIISGQLNYSVHTEDDTKLNPLNEDSIIYGFRPRQKEIVYAIEDGTETLVGRFYSDEWHSTSEKDMDFVSRDAIWIMENSPYQGGIYNTTLEKTLEDILIGFEYELDPEIANTAITGWLPGNSNRREALLQAAEAAQAIVDTSFSEKIRIRKRVTRATDTISYDRKFTGHSSVDPDINVTAVRVVGHSYSISKERAEIARYENLSAGTYTFNTDYPCTNYQITGGTIQASHSNYVVFSSSGGDVTITAMEYIDSPLDYLLENDNVPVGVEDNVISIEDATLISPALMRSVAQNQIDLSRYNVSLSIKTFFSSFRPGDEIEVISYKARRARGIVCTYALDLTGGLLVDTSIIAYTPSVEVVAYLQDNPVELYLGEEFF